MSPKKNPYVGPRAFDFGEMLYGRDDDARRLFDLLVAERIVLLYSPSGAGKTSLIHARLIPKLRQEEFVVLPTIRVNVEPALGPNVATANRYVLSALLSLEKGFPADRQLPVSELASLSVKEYLSKRHPDVPRRTLEEPVDSSRPIALIFDQFEEIITLDPTDGDAKCEFFQQVGKALRNSKFWALFSMREDFIAGLDGYVSTLPTRLSNRFRLNLLDNKQAAEAIRKPASDEGVDFSAAETLADELSQVRVQRPDGTTTLKTGSWVEPVQLQVVCRRIWEKNRKKENEIAETDLSGLQDVDTALGEYYDERIKAITAETKVPERPIREWFTGNLITERGIRGQVLRGPEDSEGLPNSAVDALQRDYLIRAEERRGATWYELAHDRLVEPIRASNLLWAKKNLSVLESRTSEWEVNGKRSQFLLRENELVAGERWAREHPTEVTPREQAYLNASRGALSDLERAAVDWELGNRNPDQLLKSGVLRVAEMLAEKKGDALSNSERALLQFSAAQRDLKAQEMKRTRLIQGLITLCLIILFVWGVSSYLRVVEDRDAEVLNSQVLAAERASLAKLVTRQYAFDRTQRPDNNEVKQRLEAQDRIQRLVPNPSEPGDSQTKVEYFVKESDREKVSAALNVTLSDIGIPVTTRPALNANRTNCLWYGFDVAEKEVKVVAYALLRGGIDLQGIQPIRNDLSKSRVIQIGRNPALAHWPPISVELLDKLPISAFRRWEARPVRRDTGVIVSFDPKQGAGTVRTSGGIVLRFAGINESVAFNVGDKVRFVVYQQKENIYAEDVRPGGSGIEESLEPAPIAERLRLDSRAQ